jgi:hypothetical protein
MIQIDAKKNEIFYYNRMMLSKRGKVYRPIPIDILPRRFDTLVIGAEQSIPYSSLLSKIMTLPVAFGVMEVMIINNQLDAQ